MVGSKECPLCQQWHSIDYREKCYERQAQRIREMEEDIAWLKKEIQELKGKPKKKKRFEDEE